MPSPEPTHPKAEKAAAALLTPWHAAHAWRRLWFVLLLITSFLALTPQPPSNLDLGWDKLNHVAAFASLAFSGFFAFGATRRQRAGAPLGLLVYGGLIEIFQLYIPGRSGEWADLGVDLLGIILGFCLAAILLAIARRLHPSNAGNGVR